MNKTNVEIKDTKSDKAFYIINTIFLLSCLCLVLFPIINIVSQSFSSPKAVISGNVFLWPVDFSVDTYKHIMTNDMLLQGYKNTIIYTVVGTTINICMTVLAAYPLSRKDFYGCKTFMSLFVFTMIFSGGMIPTYLVVKSLGLLNSMWAMLIPGALSVYNVIIARTFFQNTIPDEMIEAAEIDGATDFKIFIKVVVPLSKPVLAVLVLFYAVGHWNSYFNGLLYLDSTDLFPLQVVLRNILANAQAIEEMATTVTAEESQMAAMVEVMKYAIIVFGSAPVLMLYPIIQKYFVKGVMIGSVKG